MNTIPTLILQVWRGETGLSIAATLAGCWSWARPEYVGPEETIQLEDSLTPWEIGQLLGGN